MPSTQAECLLGIVATLWSKQTQAVPSEQFKQVGDQEIGR